MLVTDLKTEHHDDQHWTLSASVDGERIYFEYQGIDEPAALIGDAFVMAALIPTMKRKETLVVDITIPISKQLLKNLKRYQEIYRHWYPGVDEVAIEARNPIDHKDAGHKSGCFFSGGVDSIYTASKTLEQLDYLILCRGLDISITEKKRWERTHGLVKKFADNVGLKLITITTNVKNHLQCRDVDNHGAVLVSNGIGLGFERLFVPASHTWRELFPWGSHPVTDPLLGNGRTNVIHHGNVYRTEKTQEIIRFGHGLEDLRVCNVYSEYNCGKCEKCLRTMVCLEILRENVPSLPSLPNLDVVANLRLERESQYSFWQDNFRLAVKAKNSDLEAAINKTLNRYEKREHLKESDRLFLNQFMLRLKRRLL